jgi:cobalt-zinc-cadmium efflux system membrane fusion protein
MSNESEPRAEKVAWRRDRSRIALAGAAAAALLMIATAVALLHPVAGQTTGQVAATPSSDAASGSFKPTESQWKALEIETVETRSFRPERVTEGNIAIDDDLNTPVFSPFSGRVIRLIARLGDQVEGGAPLFVVEATEFVQGANNLITAVAALKTARSQLAQAEINEKRARELYQAKGGALKDWQQSQTDLATAQNTLRSAEIALAAARNQLRILGKSDAEIAALEAQPTQKLEPMAVVPSPRSGTVTQRQVGLGQYIQSVSSGASNPIYTIGDLSTVWLIANVREADAGLMHVGAPVEVRVLAFPERTFTAKLSWVAPAIDPNTRRLSVRADVQNPNGELKPMMFATFSIITGAPVTTPAVPQQAIVYEGDTARVWVAQDGGSIAARAIVTGRTQEGMVEITAGLTAGERVVTRGALFIDRAGGTG